MKNSILKFGLIIAILATKTSSLFALNIVIPDASNPINFSKNHSVTDPEYNNYSSSNFTTVSSRGRISATIDRFDKNIFGTKLEMFIPVTVTYYLIGNPTVPINITDTLKLLYDTGRLSIERDVSSIFYANAVKISAQPKFVLNRAGGIMAPGTYPKIIFETFLEIERYYNITSASVISPMITQNTNSVSVFTTTNQFDVLKFQWAINPQMEGYEIEYQFIPTLWLGSASSTYHSYPVYTGTAFNYSFRHNCTRLRVYGKESIEVPNVFDEGYVIFRVRGIGKNINSLDEESFTAWSHPESGVINLATAANAKEVNNYEPSQNWSMSVEFAEEGKNKGVISYYDGTLRPRQAVTLNKEKGVYIVSQSIFDYQGREVVSVLPVPVFDNSGYHIRPGFNKSIATNAQYSAADFDKNKAGTDEIYVAPMSNTSGAAKYYSDALPTMLGSWNAVSNKLSQSEVDMHNFTPSSGSFTSGYYPFTQVEFTKDGTGRVRRQSGIGQTHALSAYNHNMVNNTHHETHNYYGTPSQMELDILFGNEVGYAEHYKKNMVQDPNGQLSVSYLDPAGRVIATALAGNSSNTSNLMALESSNNLLEVTVEMPNTIIDAAKGLKAVSHSFVVTKGGVHKFYYDVVPEIFTIECDETELCFDCNYKLRLSLLDRNGHELFPVTANTNATVGNALPYNTSCNEAVQFNLSPNPVEVQLAPGEYTLIKYLEIDNAALEEQKNLYLNNAACIKTIDDFFEEEKGKINLNCDITCEQCEENKEAVQHRIDSIYSALNATNHLADTATNNDYIVAKFERNELKTICTEVCQTQNPCDILYQSMLTDVAPGGQYSYTSEIDANGNVIQDPVAYSLSLMNTGNTFSNCELNSISIKPSWRKPHAKGNPNLSGYYLDQSGTEALIEIINDKPTVIAGATIITIDGRNYARPHELNNISDFLEYWQPEWAENLVGYHPEYCYYNKCKAITASYEYDAKLMDEESGLEAQKRGFFNPFSMTNLGTHNGNPISYTEGTPLERDPIAGYTFMNDNHTADWNGSPSTATLSVWLNRTLSSYHHYSSDCNSQYWSPIWELYEQYKEDQGISSTDTCAHQAIWPVLRAMYLKKKKDFLKDFYYTKYCPCQACQTCGSVTSIAIKMPRFADAVSSVNGLMSNAQAGFDIDKFAQYTSGCHQATDIDNDINTELNSQCELTCQGTAEGWVEKLQNCPTIATYISNPTNKLALINSLKTVCVNGCDLENPYGSITVKPSYPSTPALPRSVYEVLELHLNPTGTTPWFTEGICDDLLLEFPLEYGHNYLGSQNPDNDTCGCKEKKYTTGDTNVCGADTFGVWNNCACDKNKDIKQSMQLVMDMPDKYKCQNCISCKDLEAPMASFFERYEQGTDLETKMFANPAVWQQMIATWLNRKLKFNLTYYDYEKFASDCMGDSLINDSSWVYLWEEMGYERIAKLDINSPENEIQYANVKGAEINESKEQFISPVVPKSAYSWENQSQVNHPIWEASLNDFAYAALSPQSSPQADKIACQCEKVLKIQALLESGQSGSTPDALWNELFGAGTTAWATAGSSYADIKKKCCKLWNQVPINNPDDCTPENYEFGAKFSPQAKDNIDQYLLPPTPDAQLASLGDAPCTSNSTNDTCRRALDTCACNKLLFQYNAWLAAGSPGSYNSWFAAKTGVNINPPSSPEAMKNICNKLFLSGSGEDGSGAGIPWTNTSTWSSTAMENLLEETEDEDLIVPGSISCDPCPTPGGGGGGPGTPWIKPRCLPKIPPCNEMALDLMDYLQNDAATPYNLWGSLNQDVALYKTLAEFMKWQDVVDEGLTPDPAIQAFLQNFRNKLDLKYNPCPGNHDVFDIDYYLMRFLFCDDLINYSENPEASCDSCFGEKREYLWAMRKFLDAIAKNRADISSSRYEINSHKLHSTNWLLINGPRDIQEFYQSKWYEGYSNENLLRYFHLKYLMPDMRVKLDDANGFDFKFQIGFNRPESWYNFSRIYSVDSIRLKRIPSCEKRDYFYLWVTLEVPKKYWNSVTGKKCKLDMSGDPVFCTKQTLMIGRIIKPKGKLAKKVACNTSCLRLCNKPFLRDVPITDSCSQELIEFAFSNAIMGYSKYIADKASEFDRLYKNKCMQAVEHTTMVVPHLQYHYTLYYYDQAGQLIKTVPPEGIDIDDRNISASQRQSMCDNRHATAVAHRSNNSNQKAITGHWLVTNYEFNTLSQAAWQKTPDAGVSEFYYDLLGRLVVSQNSKQAASATAKRYSYTRFDNLGRIAEVGEYTPTAGRTITAEKAANPIDLSAFFDNYTSNADFKEVTLSIYDIPSLVQNQTALTAAFDGAAQDNLRTRVASTYLYETLPIGSGGGMGLITNMASGSTALNGYSSATHYTYDIHGNVFTLVQDIPYLSRFNRQYFRMKYKYDLLSGNVHRVEYQPGSQDALYHKYLYDLDNRLTRVFTSRDDAHWEQDAKYYYYLHGPLMRTELGELKVQGLDYAYTMHGWLKSVNGPSLEKNKDMGRDGDYTLTSNLHTDVAKDAFAFGLDYYEGDYNSVNNSQVLPQTSGGDIHPYLKDLFNGNIRSMLTSLPDVNQYKTRNIQSHTLGFVYRYDQLNRIKEMRTFDNLNYASNQWDGSSAPLDGTARYFTEYNYDAMGNITHLKRIANQTYLPPGVAPIGTMDDLSYSYTYDVNNHLVHNRLGRVQDAVSTPYTEDLETQSAGNYTYDETGNLIADAGEQIQNIAWNVFGKIKGITRSGGAKPELEYGYGPSGERINKTVIPQTGGNREQEKKWSRTWYIRDASGNTMATYTQAVHENKHAITHAIINTVATFTLAEQHLYGFARLGFTELNRLMDSAVLNTPGYNSNLSFDNYTWQAVTVNTLATPYDNTWGGNWNLLNGRGITRGYKRYELSNHLGNVLVTVSDRHLAVDATGTTLADFFQPFVHSVQDYFPFGSSLPGREWKVSRYRYSVNTQEKEPELGDGMSSAEFWMYDGKLGRRWNADPIKYSEFSAYLCFANNPICFVDFYGLEGEDPQGATDQDKAKGKYTNGYGITWTFDSKENVWIKPMQTAIISRWSKNHLSRINDEKFKAAFHSDFPTPSDYQRFVDEVKKQRYEYLMRQYETPNAMNIGMYGRNRDGSVAVPWELRLQKMKEAEENIEQVAYKAYVAAHLKQREVYIGYSTLIHYARNDEETIEILTAVAKELALAWGLQAFGALRAVKVLGKTGASVKVSATVTKGVGKALNSVDDVLANPNLLQGKSLEQVQSVLSNSKNWVSDVMRKSTRADGWVLREMNQAGTDFTGRMIQYHPGTPRHFGGAPYWKVSSGNGTFRIPLNP